MTERVAVLAPMVSEFKPVVHAFGLTPSPSGTDTKRHRGRVGSVEVVATTTGIGMAPAEQTTERVLADEKVDLVLVVGIAGGVGSAVDVGHVFVPGVVVHGVTGAEYRPRELPGVDTRGRLVSSDAFHVEADELTELEASGVIALDMETAAIAKVCDARGCEWSVVRSISDMANDHPLGAAALAMARPDGSPNLGAVLRYVSTHPAKLPVMMKLGRDSQLAAKTAARTAARACAALA
jgi:adenosylhomocysteine nucleosidase